MTRQNNEDPAVLQSLRKTALTQPDEPDGGEKGVSVNQRARQLELFPGTAEYPKARAAGTDGKVDRPQSRPAMFAVPKPGDKNQKATPAMMMDEVVSYLRDAFQKVASNGGAPGPDGQSVEEVGKHLDEILPELSASLLEETYLPGSIRRVWIPKSGGGQRGLGIPDVVDRMVQEAVRRVLEPLYEPTFHDSSHGFRPGRSCHTAIAQAKAYVEDGREWTVDLDLEAFFDWVPHQRLMARLAERTSDRRLLVLIGRMLKAKVVMPNGVVVSREEGVPQGGPLSPLLSNIVLDELDRELDRRGHKFVRYADDSNVYVRSERAGQRVMASMIRFIEGRMRLKVNREKSAVARTIERHFVGFSLRLVPRDGHVEVQLSKRSRERIDAKIVELTPRTWGNSLRECIRRINVYLHGWLGFFSICTAQDESTLKELDAHIRRRLRAIQLKHWKTKSTMARRLVQLGAPRSMAWRRIYGGRRSLWVLSHDPAVERGLRNVYFADRGLVSLAQQWRLQQIIAPAQEQLGLELG